MSFQRISQTLKPILKGDSASIIAKRLRDTDAFLRQVKLEYNSTIPGWISERLILEYPIPNWVQLIAPDLQNYLDVKFYFVAALRDDYIEPEHSLMIFGSRGNVPIAKCYLKFIIPSVEAFKDDFNLRQLNRAKNIREQIRMGVLSDDQRMGDVRRLTSDYLGEILESINLELRTLLKIQKMNLPIQYKVDQRIEAMKTYLKNNPMKYGKTQL